MIQWVFYPISRLSYKAEKVSVSKNEQNTCLRYYCQMTACQMISGYWRLLHNRPKTAQWLPKDCLITALRLPNNCWTTAYELFDDHSLPNEMSPTQSSSMDLFGLLIKSHLYPTPLLLIPTYTCLETAWWLLNDCPKPTWPYNKRNMRGFIVQG